MEYFCLSLPNYLYKKKLSAISNKLCGPLGARDTAGFRDIVERLNKHFHIQIYFSSNLVQNKNIVEHIKIILFYILFYLIYLLYLSFKAKYIPVLISFFYLF